MTATQLLAELETLPHAARVRRMVELGRAAAHDPLCWPLGISVLKIRAFTQKEWESKGSRIAFSRTDIPVASTGASAQNLLERKHSERPVLATWDIRSGKSRTRKPLLHEEARKFSDKQGEK